MLEGIAPILFTPFDESGGIDADGLRAILRFEVDGGVHAIGINGFASEAYKMTDAERLETVAIVASELAGALPLIVGIAPNSSEAALQQARALAQYQPAALMALPPPTMDNGTQALVDFYIELGQGQRLPDHSAAGAAYPAVSPQRAAGGGAGGNRGGTRPRSATSSWKAPARRPR